jgi:L-fuconolactonase
LIEAVIKMSDKAHDYRSRLLVDTFGEDKLVFGRYWPNGSAVDNLAAIIAIAQEYFEKKSRTVAEKEFWKNSTAAYKWVHRSASRPVG